MEKIVIPSRLINRYVSDGQKYVGSVYGIHFSGTDVRGSTCFSVYNSSSRKPLTRSRSEYPATIISRGEVRNRRDLGYREDIVGDMANCGVLIPDLVLNEVFSPIENKLLRIYHRVFPDETVKPKSVRGEIIRIRHEFAGLAGRSVTGYDVKDDKGLIHRLGVNSHIDLLNVGDFVKFDFLDETNFSEGDSQPFEVMPNVVQVLRKKTAYLKIVGWEKRAPN